MKFNFLFELLRVERYSFQADTFVGASNKASTEFLLSSSLIFLRDFLKWNFTIVFNQSCIESVQVFHDFLLIKRLSRELDTK